MQYDTTMRHFRSRLLNTIIAAFLLQSRARAFSLDLRKRLPGIWKLDICDISPQNESNRKIIDLLRDNKANATEAGNVVENGVLLKIQEDGSFRQCDEGYTEGKWIAGRWELENEESSDLQSTCLKLALDRQYFGPPKDRLLTGTFSQHEPTPEVSPDKGTEIGDRNNTDNNTLYVSGELVTGKFMYPKTHPSFFEEPILANSTTAGYFSLKQKLSFFKIIPNPKNVKTTGVDEETTFKQSDFYNRKFLMTFVPAKSIPMNPKWDNNLRRYVTPGEDQPFDIRANGIEFHANNTFTIKAPDKILRGRFEIEKNNRLYFQVSLFGAGRSLKGSVYSEGPGLTQDDRRAYKGRIQKEHNHISVSGVVTFGTDRKPPEMGKFQLKQVDSLDPEVMLDKPPEDDDSIFDSVFE